MTKEAKLAVAKNIVHGYLLDGVEYYDVYEEITYDSAFVGLSDVETEALAEEVYRYTQQIFSELREVL